VPYNRDLGIEWAKDWYYLAEAYRRKGKFNLAILYFNQSKMMAYLLDTPEIHFVYTGLARTYADMGDTEKAVRYYTRGLDLLESVQIQQGTEEVKIGVLEGALYAYRGFVTLLLDIHTKTGKALYLHEAFKSHERLKARAFLDMLGRSRMTRLGGEVGISAAKAENVRRQIAWAHHKLKNPKLTKEEETRLLNRLGSLRESLRTLQLEAAQKSSRYAQIVFPRPTTIEEVQTVLAPDTVMLEYAVSSKGSTLWAITKDHVQAYSLPGSKKMPVLKQYLKTVREPLMGVDEVSQHLALGRQLYQALVSPAEKQIRGKKHLIIVPDGPLYYLPFEALIMPESQDNANEPQRLADVRYLVKEFRVTYAPSASVWLTQRKKHGTQVATARFPLVAFGDPVYREADSAADSNVQTRRVAHQVLRGGPLSRLEFSAQEVQTIASIWNIPPDSAHINLRDRATVERVREMDLSQYRMMHFATHGVLGDEIGLTTQPALVLSQIGDKNQHGGLLQLHEILDLKLNADLVVLSACNTGLGRLREGEGIVGLTRAFLYAGASSVVVSLWKVEDQSTSLLMERFYQRLKQGEGKAEALRQAKLDMMRAMIELKAIGMHQSLASPFYWAPFILVGEGH
jgi:CHAT domain-containing protein